MPVPRLPVFLAVFLIAGASAAGCSLDWSVRDAEGEPADAAAEDAPAAVDAMTEASSDAGPDGPDAPDAPGPDCAALANDVDAKLAAAKTCTSPGAACAVTKDPCGCDVSVNPSGEIGYDQTVATYKASCTPSCATCGQPITTTFCVGTTSAASCSP